MICTFIMGPIVTTLSVHDYFRSHETWNYLKVLTLYIQRDTLPGVFIGNPIGRGITTTVWTLKYEFSCYIALPLLAYFGLLRARVMLLIFVLSWIIRTHGSIAGFAVLPDHLFSFYDNPTLKLGIDFCPGFAAGAFMYLMRERIPLRSWLVIAALALLVVSAYLWGECMLYHIALTYIIIGFGFMKNSVLNNFSRYGDFSYGMYIYGWPVQELFLYYWKGIHFITYFVVCSLVSLLCAVLSWHLVEKPALSYKV
jgi:peptidoglycan/LPS O-acetylase OafA/YrhL